MACRCRGQQGPGQVAQQVVEGVDGLPGVEATAEEAAEGVDLLPTAGAGEE